MLLLSAKSDEHWLPKAREALRQVGCAVVTDVLAPGEVERTREAMYRTQEQIVAEVGEQRLLVAGEVGVLRIPALFDPVFLELLSVPEMLAIIDEMLGDTAILHLQNGFILPPRAGATEKGFQHTFHRDFPRHLHGYVASLNVMLVLDDFTELNGGTLVVPGTHQRPEQPAAEYLEEPVGFHSVAGRLERDVLLAEHVAGRSIARRDELLPHLANRIGLQGTAHLDR